MTVAFALLVAGALLLGWIKRCHLFDDQTDKENP